MKPVIIKIKPISINTAWQGQRFKTSAYKDFEKEMLYLLPKKIEIPKGKISLGLMFAFSNKGQDIDSPIKLVLDILQKRYAFNDKMIYELYVWKKVVKKGEETIEFVMEDII